MTDTLREQVALAIYRELEGHDPFEKDVSPLGSASGRMADAALAVVKANLLVALDEALDTVEDLVIQHCYAESDGSYDTSALSTNRDAFDLLVRAGRAKYVGEQVGRRAFIRLREGE